MAYNQQHGYCSQADSIKRIQNSLKEVTGREWNVKVEWDTADELPAGQTATETPVPKAVTYRQRESEVATIPLINRAVEKMGARLLKMDEGFGSGEPSPPEDDAAQAQES